MKISKILCYAYLLGSTLNASDCARKSYTYKEVFDALVQAVLEGDIIKFNQERRRYDPHQRISFCRSLRHVAWKEEIDSILLHDCKVAPINLIEYSLIPEEFGKYTDAQIRSFFYKNGRSVVSFHTKYERNPGDKDVYGKFPEGYTAEQKKEVAIMMIKSPYTAKVGMK